MHTSVKVTSSPSRWIRLIAGISAAAILFGPCPYGMPNDEQGEATLSELAEAWRRRENQCETLEFNLEETETFSTQSTPEFTMSRKQDAIAKADDSYLECINDVEVRLSGVKFDFRSSTRDAVKFKKTVGRRTSFDGHISQNYSGLSRPTRKGSGEVSSKEHAFGVHSQYLLPLIVTYRPLHDTLGRIDLTNHAITTDRVPVGDHLCAVLQELPGEVRIRKYYVDPENDFVVRRYELSVRGRDTVRIDIDYLRDAEYGPVPTHWSCVIFGANGRVDSSLSCDVKSYTINEAIPDAEFQIEYPAGTLVQDHRTGRIFISKGAMAGSETGDPSVSE